MLRNPRERVYTMELVFWGKVGGIFGVVDWGLSRQNFC